MHIAFIMDGNGRWAIHKGQTRAEGHDAGIETAHTIMKACVKRQIKNATFSFFNEMKQSKIKTNTNLIDWMVNAFETFTSNNPLSLHTDTEDGSANEAVERRNPLNPWGRQQQQEQLQIKDPQLQLQLEQQLEARLLATFV
jgi:undecaprenyl pyrophosphate synthase